jgi:hypothetical protein
MRSRLAECPNAQYRISWYVLTDLQSRYRKRRELQSIDFKRRYSTFAVGHDVCTILNSLAKHAPLREHSLSRETETQDVVEHLGKAEKQGRIQSHFFRGWEKDHREFPEFCCLSCRSVAVCIGESVVKINARRHRSGNMV